ncbi:MAG TPA: POTRA domain-containing protein [Thermoanaerobaculia bacterium]|nr:POTRA domain-containing protein [Thermoanaerobaculia bacterium]
MFGAGAGRGRAARALLFFACAAAFAGASGGQEPLPADLGRNVVSVAYTSDGPVDSAEIARLLDIRVGQPLTDKVTSGTIRNLFATGRFSNVEIEATPAADGVAVVVHLFRSYRIKPLRFAHAPLARDELARTVGFSEGSVFDSDDVKEGALAIKRRLEAEGYLDSQVTPEVTFDSTKFDARVVYRVAPGKVAPVAPAFFDGDTKPFTAEDLRARLKLKPGKRYREAKARSDATRLISYLQKQGRLRGTAELIAAQPTDDGRIMPVYRIAVGPHVIFEATGIKQKKVESEFRVLLEGQVFDEDLVLQYVENKRRDLQSQGFYRARVEYSIAESPDTYAVRILVDPGPHLEVEKIAFRGNASVPAETLRGLMGTRKRGLPFLQPGHLVQEELDEDLSAILGYYQLHGWVAAKVNRPVVTEGSKPNRLVLTIPIEEGARASVRSRRIEGLEHRDMAPVDRSLRVQVGKPYNPELVREDVTSMQTELRDHGWGEAVVRAETQLSSDGTGADLVYRVDEGLRSFFGKTIIRGNSRTDTARVRRLVTWQENRPYSESELLDTQRNLSRAGVFRRVEIRPQPADPENRTRNVYVELEEGRPLSLLYGAGYQYAPDATENQNDPFIVGGISYNNLFGRMLSAGLEGQVSISGRYRLQLSFRDPYFFGRDVVLSSFFFATREPIQDVDIDRLGFVNELSHYFGKYLRGSFRAEYQRIRPVNPQNLSAIEQSDFPRFDQPIEEATVGPTAFYDRRDDIIDPHRGYYTSAAIKYAFPLFQAEARYTKFSTQIAGFRPVGKAVVAASARFGGIFPYGPSDIQVPIAERFFAGGESTGRGFQRDLLGIPGQTVDYDTRATLHHGTGDGSCTGRFPDLKAYDCNAGPHIIGGNGFFAFNAEYRYPIFGGLGGTVFYDLAQVWKTFSDVNLRLEGERGLRQTVGVGLHYMTPIGPLRAEFGYPLSPKTISYDVVTRNETGERVILGPGGRIKEHGRFVLTIGYPF